MQEIENNNNPKLITVYYLKARADQGPTSDDGIWRSPIADTRDDQGLVGTASDNA